MWTSVGLIGGFCCLVWAIVSLAIKIGKKMSELEALKAKAKARKNANKTMDNVRNMSYSDVRNRLQNLSDK